MNGAAVGAGMNMALGCDVRIAGASARFDTRFLQLGIHPGGGHTWMLRRIAGPQAAAALVLFGDVVDGTEAARIGLVHRCVPDDELLAAAHAFAAQAASAPRELLVTTKQTLSDMAGIAVARRRRRPGDRAAAVEHPPAVVPRAPGRAPGPHLQEELTAWAASGIWPIGTSIGCSPSIRTWPPMLGEPGYDDRLTDYSADGRGRPRRSRPRRRWPSWTGPRRSTTPIASAGPCCATG